MDSRTVSLLASSDIAAQESTKATQIPHMGNEKNT